MTQLSYFSTASRGIAAMLLIVFGFIHSPARRLSPNEAFSRVASRPFSSKTPPPIGSAAAKLAFACADSAVYVFDLHEGGSMIVSGDDLAEPLLAIVPSGHFGSADIPPAAKYWIEEYARQIEWLRADANICDLDASDDLAALYATWEPIPPLMTCEWNQDSPYNNLCPVKSGSRCVTGCVPTAMAQVIRTIGYAEGHGFKAQGSGDERVEMDFDNTVFDFANMPDRLSSLSSPEHIDAVSRLMLACGLSIEAGYGTESTGGLSESVPYALSENFGYDPNFTRYLSRSRFPEATWESTIYEELRLGRPVYYDGTNNSLGHAFVIDGYDSDGLWHVNWGWGGMSNGYFRLSALKPYQQGVGGNNSHYNYGQGLIKAVPTGADPGIVHPDMGGSICMVGDNVYSVFFQSLGTINIDVTLGAVIVDSSGKQVGALPFWKNQTMTSASRVFKNDYEIDFTSVALHEGAYRIYPAVAPSGSDSFDITAPCAGRQHFIYLTVAPSGEYIFSNDASEGLRQSFDLHVSEIGNHTNLLSGYTSPLEVTLVNNGLTDFYGSMHICIADPADGSILAKERLRDISIPASSNTTLEVSLTMLTSDNSSIAPGKYPLMIMDDNLEKSLLNDTLCVEVVNGVPANTWYEPADLAVTNGSSIPETLYKDTQWPHIPQLKCFLSSTLYIYARFYTPSTTYSLKSYLLYEGRPGYFSGPLDIKSAVIDLPVGVYDVAYTKSKEIISETQRVRIGAAVDGIYYLPLDGDRVEVGAHPCGAYTGDIAIPRRVSIEGKSFEVAAIAAEAFKGCRGLRSVTIPQTVTSVGRDAFAYCPDMEYLIFHSDLLPFDYRNHIAQGLNHDTEFYIPVSLYDEASSKLRYYHPVFAAIDSIRSAVVEPSSRHITLSLAIYPAHEGVNGSFTVVPVDEDDPAASVEIDCYENGALHLSINARHEGVADFLIVSAQPGVDPANLRVSVSPTAGISSVITDFASDHSRCYNLDGRQIPNSEIPSGKVILITTPAGTKKVIR